MSMDKTPWWSIPNKLGSLSFLLLQPRRKDHSIPLEQSTALIIASSLYDDKEHCFCVQGREAALLQNTISQL